MRSVINTVLQGVLIPQQIDLLLGVRASPIRRGIINN